MSQTDRISLPTMITYATLGNITGFLDSILGSLSISGPYGVFPKVTAFYWNSSDNTLTIQLDDTNVEKEAWKYTIRDVVIDSVSYKVTSFSNPATYKVMEVLESPFDGAAGVTDLIISGFTNPMKISNTFVEPASFTEE